VARVTAADRVAEEVAARLETLATLTAEAVLSSIYRPQVADATSDQQLDYWATELVPNGVFSPEGRDRVVAQVGAPEYKSIALSLARRARKQAREEPEETAPTALPTEPPPAEEGY